MIPVPQSFDSFRKRYGSRIAGSVEEVGDCISQKIGPYSAKAKAQHHNGAHSEFASCVSADLTLNWVNWGAPMVGTALEDHNRFCISLSLEGYAETFDPKLGYIRPTQSQARVFSWSPGTQTICSSHNSVVNLGLPFDLLQSRVRTFFAEELNEPLQFAPLLNLHETSAVPMLSLINYLRGVFTDSPETLENPLVVSSLREHAISAILSGLQHNYSEQNHSPKDVAIPKSVKRAEEFMRAHADQVITVERLAKEANCSERALHAGFRDFRRASPMSVLRDIRLEGARQDLSTGAGSVTDCAHKWGFTNPGRFAKLYTERFDEKPSQTLRGR